MPRGLDPFRFLLIAVAGWMNHQQLQTIDSLREENRVLRELLAGRRLRLNDDQRRRLAARAKGLGRKILAELATIVTPETLLAWHRKLIAEKYDGSGRRGVGRPSADDDVENLWCAWPKRTATGGMGASRARSPTSATSWHAARLPRFSNAGGWNRRRIANGRPPGRSS